MIFRDTYREHFSLEKYLPVMKVVRWTNSTLFDSCIFVSLFITLFLSFLSYTQASKYSRLLANGQNSLYWRSVMHRKYPVKMCLDSTSIIYSYCFREILVFFVYISTKFLYFISIINIYIFYISLSHTLSIYSLQNIEFFFSFYYYI